MGDPEKQVVLPLLKTSLFKILFNTVKKNLNKVNINVSSNTALTVVLASNGYPEKYNKGQKIFTHPIPNLIFTRDISVCIGKTILITWSK